MEDGQNENSDSPLRMSKYSIFGEKQVIIKSQDVHIYGTDDNTFTYNDKRILTSSDLISLGPVGTSPNANGLSLVNGVLNGQPASATQPGFLTSGTQTIGGNKTWNGTATFGSSASVGTTLGVTGVSTLTGGVVSTNVQSTNAASGSRTVTISSDGTFTSYDPSNIAALVTIPNGATTIGSDSVLALGAISGAANSGISISSNNIVITRPGSYIFIPGMNITTPAAPNSANIFMQMRVGSTPNGSDLGLKSDQECGQVGLPGVDNPYHFIFTAGKSTGTSTPNYVSFISRGDSLPTTGTPPAWTGSNFVQIVYNSTPTF